jgi:hypothetical protein
MTDLTRILTATIDYEESLRREVDVVEADLRLKHRVPSWTKQVNQVAAR